MVALQDIHDPFHPLSGQASRPPLWRQEAVDGGAEPPSGAATARAPSADPPREWASFDIPGEVAWCWLSQPNPGRHSDADVVRPWVNGMDLTRRPRHMWVVDFALRSEADASAYLAPFEYIQESVRPDRLTNKRETYRRLWWRHVEPCPAMRWAFEGLTRCICTPRVAKHRLFVWLPVETVPDSAVIAITRDDDFTFGVLHSRLHEV